MFLMTIELTSDDDVDHRAKQCVVGITSDDRTSLSEDRTLGIPLDMVPNDAFNVILVHADTQQEAVTKLGIDMDDDTAPSEATQTH